MIKSYWTMAWRSLVRNKIYSLVNVLGLALGICACLVIYLITTHQFSFDTFHPDKDRIYCVDPGIPGSNDDHSHYNSVPAPMPAAMRREITGFETVAAFQHFDAKVTIPGKTNEKPTKFPDAGRMIIAEPQFFDIFHYQWLSGNAATALNNPNTVVLTKSKAKQYFGDLTPEAIIGKTIIYEDSLPVTVTGILADWTHNSDFDFTQFISYSTIPSTFLKNEFPLDNWNQLSHSSQVMVKLAKGVTPQQVDAQFVGFTKRHLDPQQGFAVLLKPLSGIHFHREYGGEGNKASRPVLYTLMSVAAFILILAVINFVNLSTAQSIQRAREVGVRKVLGSGRSGIAIQFLTETFLLTLAAAILAVAIASPILNVFKEYVPPGFHFQIGNSSTLLFLLAITIVTTLVTGFYPAKVLASFLPALTLKGKTTTEGSEKGTLRKSLIVFQFTISLVFIIASIVIGSQLRYMLKADLGFKTDAVLTLRPNWNDQTGKAAVLAEKIKGFTGVTTAIREAIPPMGRAHMGDGAKLKGSDQKLFEVSVHAGNEDYLPFYNMKLIAGRNLLHSDSAREILINATCAHGLGFTDPSKAIGREMIVGGGDKSYPIAGVVADFNENSLRQSISPIVIMHIPLMEHTVAVKIAAKGMAAGEIKALTGKIETEWKKLYPEETFSFSFLDESIANLYDSDIKTEWLTNIAMGVTIFVSCLGLLGLAIFSTETRTREIGIRKVLGASVSGIVILLCKNIVLLIAIALLIATPIAWWLMHGWLQGFAYRTQLTAWMFLAAGTAAIGIALLTVGFQAMKAAMANPIKALRTE